MTSSRKIAPGCVGTRVGRRAAMSFFPFLRMIASFSGRAILPS
jgi:hypothetical protein